MDDKPIDEHIKRKSKKKKKKNAYKPLSWGAVIFYFVLGVLLPCAFIFFVVKGVDSGYWGGRPGYVSGSGVMVWFIGKLHLIIVGTAVSVIVFIIMLITKIYDEIKAKLER
jgi:uncharacterized membrane protein YgaE (UPF0421/DUF939 family)